MSIMEEIVRVVDEFTPTTEETLSGYLERHPGKSLVCRYHVGEARPYAKIVIVDEDSQVRSAWFDGRHWCLNPVYKKIPTWVQHLMS